MNNENRKDHESEEEIEFENELDKAYWEAFCDLVRQVDEIPYFLVINPNRMKQVSSSLARIERIIESEDIEGIAEIMPSHGSTRVVIRLTFAYSMDIGKDGKDEFCKILDTCDEFSITLSNEPNKMALFLVYYDAFKRVDG